MATLVNYTGKSFIKLTPDLITIITRRTVQCPHIFQVRSRTSAPLYVQPCLG